MAIRAKTKRRLFILLGSMAAVIALGVGIYTVRMSQIRADVLQAREVGMSALEQGDYHQAMHSLGRYLQHHTGDAEVTYHYAQARLNVQEADGRHLVQGAEALRRAGELNPDRPEIRRQLLTVYSQIGFFNETIELARSILAAEPDNAEVIRAEVDALIRLRMYDRVEAVAERCLERDAEGAYARPEPVVLEGLRARALALHQQSRFPAALPVAREFTDRKADDFEMQRLMVELLYEVGRSAQEQRTYVQRLRAAQPDDLRFAVLQAIVARQVDDAALARRALQDAIASDLRDPEEEVALALISELDRQQMYNETLEVMTRIAPSLDALGFQRSFAVRLATAEQWDGVLQRFGPERQEIDRTDSVLLAIAAMAKFEQDNIEDGRRMVEELSSRTNDPTAVDWAQVLSTVYDEQPPASPQQLIEVVHATEQNGANNPFFQHWLARAYQQIDESDLAIAAWQRAAEAAPNWPLPLLELSQALLQSNQPRLAAGVAQLALQRSPGSVQAAILLAEGASTQWASLTAEQMDELQSLVQQIQDLRPFEPRSLALQVRLLTLDGDDEGARARVAQALEADAPLPETTLLQLAELMATAEAPDLQKQLLDRLGPADGSASDMAVMHRVQTLMEAGDREQGLALIEARLDAAEDEQARRAWRLRHARVLDSLGDTQAVSAWAELVKDYPDDLLVHQRVLESSTAWQDRAMMERAIARTRALAGETSLGWRVARARWLLGGSEGQRSSSEVTDLLQYVVDQVPHHLQARLLLAQRYEQTGNTSAAISQLNRVVQTHPAQVEHRLHLARLLEGRGDEPQARMHMEQVVQAGPRMDAAQRQRAARLLVERGDADGAISLLAPHQDESVEQALTLAQIYTMAGRTEDAEQLYARLLEQPTQRTVERAAHFYLRENQVEQAKQTLALLDELDLPPGQRERIYGDFFTIHNDPVQARDYYRQAVQAAPTRAGLWRRRAAHAVGTGDLDEAVAMLAEASETLPDNDALRQLAEQREAIRTAGRYPVATPVIVALINDPAHHEVGLEVVQALSAAAEGQAAPDMAAALPALRDLAEQHPSFLALQSMVYQTLMAQGEHAEAIAVAQQSVEAIPDAIEPMWMLAEALSAAGQWSEAMRVAEQWRERGGARMAEADQLIAEAQLNLGDASAALQQVEPYLEQALAAPDEHAPLILRAARAMIAAGQVDRAREMLEPLLQRSPQWRAIWLQLAVETLQDDEAARWLTRAEDELAADAQAEHYRLAQAWWTLHERTQAQAHRDQIQRIMVSLAEGEPPYAPAVMALAMLAEMAGDVEAAEQGYRQALALDPGLPVAANNLAMILVQRGESLSEAVTLAQRAVEGMPQHALFRHTLAEALQAHGDEEQALDQMHRAVELDPNSPRWQVALIALLMRQRDHAGAGEMLAALDAQFPQMEDVPEEVRDDLQAVRDQWAEQQRRSERSGDEVSAR